MHHPLQREIVEIHNIYILYIYYIYIIYIIYIYIYIYSKKTVLPTSFGNCCFQEKF